MQIIRKTVNFARCVSSRIAPGTKFFCIGRNKTGTTTLKQSLRDLGYRVGDQSVAERMLPYYINRSFRPIISYCHTAQAFQDMPFSYPFTYQVLDYAFPEAKFIMSVRDSADEWYRSITQSHTKYLHLDHIPTKDDLMNATYIYRGAMWDINRTLYNTPEDDPYNEKILKESYMRYCEDAMMYFKHRDNFLIINVAENGSYKKFCDFLGRKPVYDEFPWLNKT